MSYQKHINGKYHEVFSAEELFQARHKALSQIERKEENTVLVEGICVGCGTEIYYNPITPAQHCHRCWEETNAIHR